VVVDPINLANHVLPETASFQGADRVLLIHGTGSASVDDEGHFWWQRGSDFRHALDEVLDCKVLCGPGVFHWSGKNSERERRLGASRLLENLRDLDSRNLPYHLIGHSHGGSVIWAALRNATVSGLKLRHLRSWTTLGTPFLQFAPAPVNWWLSLPLLISLAGLLDFAWADRRTLLVSHSYVHSYFAHMRELWQLGEYGTVLLFPLMWLVLVGILSAVISVAWASFRSYATARARYALDIRTFGDYGDRYLGLWSPSDEAINGLGSTLGFGGDVTPKWGLKEASTFSRITVFLSWPVRAAYNAILARATDELIWDRVAKRLQGNDSPGFALRRVTPEPTPGYEGWPAIPTAVNDEMVALANQNAAATLAAARTAIGLSATAGPSAPSIITGIGTQFSFHELVHTSYYTSGPIQELIAVHIRTHASTDSDASDENVVAFSPLTAWYLNGRQSVLNRKSDPVSAITNKAVTLHFVQGVVLTMVAALAWVATSASFRASIYPLTEEYQIQSILSASEDIVPSVYWSQGLSWLRALVVLGDLDRATKDAFQLDTKSPDEGPQGLVSISAMLRAMGRDRDATNRESQALELAKHIQNEQYRNYALASLAEEQASYGILREDLVAPGVLTFLRNDYLMTVIRNLAESGRPDLAWKILPQDLTPRDYEKAIEPILLAWLKRGEIATALEAVRSVKTEDLLYSTPTVMAVYAATGKWGEAESLAGNITYDDSRNRAFGALARLRIDSGNAQKSLEDAAQVRSWQYISSDAAHIAAGWEKAGYTAEAKQLALKTIVDVQLYDNAWANLQSFIDAEQDLREAGAAVELEAAENVLFAKCRKQYVGEVLGRAVYSLMQAGETERAYKYVLSFPLPESRAESLPVAGIAFLKDQRNDLVELALNQAQRELLKIPGEQARSQAYAAIARTQAHLHRYRAARLNAERCVSLIDRLGAYAEILNQYSIEHDPNVLSQLADPRSSRTTLP
jgi:hypothetical protein